MEKYLTPKTEIERMMRMKGYMIPKMGIHRFDSDEILTGSAGNVDNWNETQNLNAKTIDWKTDLKTADGVLAFNN